MNCSAKASAKNREKGAVERCNFDPGEIFELGKRLTSNIIMLEAFLSDITEPQTQKSLAKVEKKTDKQEQGEAEGSVKSKEDLRAARKASIPLAPTQAGDQLGLQQFALESEGRREDLLLWACCENRTDVVEMLLANSLDSFKKPLNFDRTAQAGVEQHCGYTWCYEFESFPDIYPRGANSAEPKKCSLDVCTKKALDNRTISGALVAAASGGSVNIAEILLEYGASITGRDRLGYTALGAAASSGRSDMLGWLLGLDSMKFQLLLDFQPRFVYLEIPGVSRRETDGSL